MRRTFTFEPSFSCVVELSWRVPTDGSTVDGQNPEEVVADDDGQGDEEHAQ